MFENTSTRELTCRRTEIQTTAFGMMTAQMEVPESLGSDFDEIDRELKRREEVFNQHRVTQPIVSLLDDLLSAISTKSLSNQASRLSHGYTCSSKQCKLNPKNPFFDEISLSIKSGAGDNDTVEETTFHLRLVLTLDELRAFVPDLSESEANSAGKSFRILRMSENTCGAIDFFMEQQGNALRLDRVVVSRL